MEKLSFLGDCGLPTLIRPPLLARVAGPSVSAPEKADRSGGTHSACFPRTSQLSNLSAIPGSAISGISNTLQSIGSGNS